MLTSLNVPTKEIVDRFMEAIDMLKSDKTIPGLVYFCEAHQLPKTTMFTLKNHFGKVVKILPMEAVYILALEYGFSLDWLILGIGKPKKRYRIDA
ncbi:hypothetical protein [Epilithonimonas xixisoli]|uniref:Bacteriophage CI repressor-like protein n=1 Tax=Epilithonimonas xixisoli TaxID=1476462 RepID=A0A4R8I4X3_9FLAO|nr:hypothetical protein [Epilithonimonas xixisoli]TDX83933.1 hypothetical protein B0I22_1521 [Epilithonimonas xixisoli]